MNTDGVTLLFDLVTSLRFIKHYRFNKNLREGILILIFFKIPLINPYVPELICVAFFLV